MATARTSRFVDRWRRGRLAAAVAAGYLVAVTATFAFVLVDITLVAHADASFSGVWAFFVTLPLSLVVLFTDPATGAGLLVEVALCGLVQAAVLWFVLRGRRVDR